MAQNKVYELLDATVAPSKVKSIEFNTVNEARYRIRHCMGKVGNAIRYSDNSTLITFMHPNDEGKMEAGLQVEQLAIVMKDFLLKQDNPDPVKIAALNTFLGITEEGDVESAE